MSSNIKYPYVIGMNTPLGWVWKVQGDNISSFTKKDCEVRIRMLCNGGQIDKEHRNYLLNELKSLKRGLKGT